MGVRNSAQNHERKRVASIMQTETAPIALGDPLLYEQFEKDLKFLQLFLLLVNNSCPIKRVELVWAEDGPAGRVGLRQKFLSTEQALAGPCAHMLASTDAPEPLFCNTVNDYGRHEAESCAISDKAAEMRVRRTGKAEVYTCHAGLIDIAVPVICEGQYIATLFTGQVLLQPPSHSHFVQIQKQIAPLTYINWTKLENAYNRVPVVSESDIQRTIEVLELFADYLATTWKRLAEIVREQKQKHRESQLERKEFGHLVLEGNLADRPLVRRLMSRIGFTRYPNCVMVVKFESEGDHHYANTTAFDLMFTRAFQAIEELCDRMQNVCCTSLRSQGICIFFRDRESVTTPPAARHMAQSFASRVLETVSARCELKLRIGIGAPKSNWSYLADSYHEGCTALAGSTKQIAIYRPLSAQDEELSIMVGRICRMITEKQILNARMLVLGIPLLVNKKIDDRPESLSGQRHFFLYTLDAMLFAARQLGSNGHGGADLYGIDKQALENATSAFELQESFIQLAESLLDSVSKLFAGRPRKLVDRARIMIDRALEDPSSTQTLSIIKIAAALGISAGHLSRIFKRATGVTLERHLMIRRVETAKRLLLDPLENIYDIAEKCGFSDSAYFARVFRKIAGCSPRQYRDDPMRFAANEMLTRSSERSDELAMPLNRSPHADSPYNRNESIRH